MTYNGWSNWETWEAYTQVSSHEDFYRSICVFKYFYNIDINKPKDVKLLALCVKYYILALFKSKKSSIKLSFENENSKTEDINFIEIAEAFLE